MNDFNQINELRLNLLQKSILTEQDSPPMNQLTRPPLSFHLSSFQLNEVFPYKDATHLFKPLRIFSIARSRLLSRFIFIGYRVSVF